MAYAAVIAAVLLAVIAVFQLALAFGAPLGDMALTGSVDAYRVLHGRSQRLAGLGATTRSMRWMGISHEALQLGVEGGLRRFQVREQQPAERMADLAQARAFKMPNPDDYLP